MDNDRIFATCGVCGLPTIIEHGITQCSDCHTLLCASCRTLTAAELGCCAAKGIRPIKRPPLPPDNAKGLFNDIKPTT